MENNKIAMLDISFTVKEEAALDELQELRTVLFDQRGKTVAEIAATMDVPDHIHEGMRDDELSNVSPIHTVRTHKFLAASFTVAVASHSAFNIGFWAAIAGKCGKHICVCAIGQDGAGTSICAEATAAVLH